MIEPPATGLEPVFRTDATVGGVEDYGVTAAGHRRVVPILGGAISGGIEAELLPGGSDWQIVRDDGTVEIDTRYSARTPDDELVHIRTRGLRTGPPDVLRAVLAGAEIPPTAYYFRVVVTIESSAPRFDWLQRSIIVAAAARSHDRVVYDAYRVT